MDTAAVLANKPWLGNLDMIVDEREKAGYDVAGRTAAAAALPQAHSMPCFRNTCVRASWDESKGRSTFQESVKVVG